MPSSQLGVGLLGDFMLGLPTSAPPPSIRSVPLLERIPDQERRLSRFTELVSAIVNSLSTTGQLVQDSPAEFHLVVTPTDLQIVPGAQPATDPYAGQLWVDASGNLHYLDSTGIDTQLTGNPSFSDLDFFSGHGAPADAIGEVNDHYFDIDSGKLYKKV